jgi:lectin, mannose-binding 2
MSLILKLLTAFAVVVQFACATRLENQSFEPPFNDVDAAGNRFINNKWKSSGTAVVNTNFVRLTPDRQSKKGALWAKSKIGVPSFSSIFKFRISGQGKNFFGDGIALWMTQNSYYKEGGLHGLDEKFYGIGIIFDTFKNTENIGKHRDVTVLVNDGELTYEMMTEDVKGCAANIRYHADRADFSVTDSSRAKVMVTENRMFVLYIDAGNTGEWVECVTLTDLPLKSDWAVRAYMGVSASTGALADNHDVLSLLTFSDAEVMEVEEREQQQRKEFEVAIKEPTTDRLARLEEMMNTVLTRLSTLDHHLEHEFASVEDHIKVMGGKLEARENKAEGRIDNLEEQVKKQVEGTLAERLNVIERQLKGSVDRKITSVSDNLQKKIDVKVEKTAASRAAAATGATAANSGDWKIPFAILLLIFVAGAIMFYRFYEKMKRSHIL